MRRRLRSGLLLAASGLPSLHSDGCAAPNMGADRYAVTDRSVYSFSLSVFVFCMRRVNALWLSLKVAPRSRATRVANRGPQSSVQSRASATDTERGEPSSTPSRAPVAVSAAHKSAAVSLEASSHARLNKTFLPAKGQDGATKGASKLGAP